MKPASTYLWVPLIAFSLVLSNCRKAGAGMTPTQTAEKFLTAMQFGDYKEAARYASDETADLLKYQRVASKPFLEGFTITREEVSGDYARVYYTEEDQSEEFVKLKREGEAWVVIMTKSELRPNNIFDQIENESQNRNSKFDTLTDHERTEMATTAEEFLSALETGDLETAKFHSDDVTESWLEDHGKEENYILIWKKGYKVNGKIFIGRTGKIIYSIPSDKTQYQLRMNFSLGTWEVSYDGPEQWDGLGKLVPILAEGMEEAAMEMGNAMKGVMKEVARELEH